MPIKAATQRQLLAEDKDLRVRLAQSEANLHEMRSGEVDALVIPQKGGAQLFTLKDADQSFRILVEKMSEGALTMTAEGVIVHANRRLAAMLKTPLHRVIGSTVRPARSAHHAVADVIEAMSSHRPYRAGLGIDKALAEIERGRGRGTIYDPVVVDACMKLFREKAYALPA